MEQNLLISKGKVKFSKKGVVSKFRLVLEIDFLAPCRIPTIEGVERPEQPKPVERVYYRRECAIPLTLTKPGHDDVKTTREVKAILFITAVEPGSNDWVYGVLLEISATPAL